jgi:transcriptional regulator with XRE-family HTH domain
MSATSEQRPHIGRNIEHFRRLRGKKQEEFAELLGVTQQTVSKMEQSEEVDEERLEKVAMILDVPVEAIKKFNADQAINIIVSTVNNHDQSAVVFHNPVFHPVEKISELYEQLLKSKQEQIVLLERLLKKYEGQ